MKYLLLIILILVIIFIFCSKYTKKYNLLNKTLLCVIILLIFYIVKVGGINLMDKVNKDNKTTSITKNTTKIKESTTLSTTSTTISSTTTTKKITVSTTKKQTTTSVSNADIKIIDGVLIVNKTYPLPSDYIPTNTYKDATGLNYCSNCLSVDTYEAFNKMKADATSLGLNIWIQSGYRSYSLQESLYNKYVNRDGKEAEDTYIARPGHSEHQTGLAFDLNTITDDFQYTNEGLWVNNNCYKYGFILRYPKGKEHITGYKYESWHLRYVGVELATKLYNNGDWITLEEYFNITSKYND